jgi:transcriptional regulator with XRE-family HTH domain
MFPIVMMSPEEICLELARRARARRLEQNLSQQGLADRAGVSLGSLKRFERTGQIALSSLIRLAIVLDALDELQTWFMASPPASIEEALGREVVRQRGRR